MAATTSVSPFKCRVWNLHQRLDTEIDEETCKEEIASFLEHGQLIAALGRRLHGDPDHEIEVIVGARRLFVARHLNQPLLVEVRDLTDREAIIAMDTENRQRKDVSPYERGIAYAQWLRARQFESQEDMARVLNLSASQVCRLLRLARLPAVIVAAFRSPVDITEAWGVELMDALEDDHRREATIRAARALARCLPRLPGREVFRRLIGAVVYNSRQKHRLHDKIVLSNDGSPLFRIRYQNRSIALILPAHTLSGAMLEQIELKLASVLQGADGAGDPRPVQPRAKERLLPVTSEATASMGRRHRDQTRTGVEA